MRLNGFSIENFRSIQKSGWCGISSEDVAVLVGQNEAGKSSILEALMAFQTHKLDQNDLRSDDSSPKVACEYLVTADELKKWFAPLTEMYPGIQFEPHVWPSATLKVVANWLPSKPSEAVISFDSAEAEELLAELATALAAILPEVEELNLAAQAAPSLEANLKAMEAHLKATDSLKTALKVKLASLVKQQLPAFVLFNDADCLLPSTIDILNDELVTANGEIGAKNFLTVAGLDIKVLLNTSDRHRASMLANASKQVTDDLQKFWTQQVGNTQKIEIECDLKNYGGHNNNEKIGKSYLVFYISEASDKLYPSQRSKGVRWFLSFFLQLWAAAKSNKSVVFLLDEPGSNLHAKAQQNVLQVIERSCAANQVIYSTHSPDLIRADKLGRVLAVQRDDADSFTSPTTVISAHRLSGASVDTMSAVYRAMGADFSHQQVIQKSNNVLLEELSALYYLKGFFHLHGIESVPNFLPATGATNIPMIANLLTGWGIEFLVLLDDDNRGREVAKILGKELFLNDEKLLEARVHRIKKCDGIEDLFEPLDFALHVLNEPNTKLDGKCSSHVKKEAKAMLAYQFWCKVERGDIQLEIFSDATKVNVAALLQRIEAMLNQQKTVA